MRLRRPPFSQFQPSCKTCVLILASLFCLLVAAGLGQEPIRVNVRLVNVAFFSARDSRGALVENLTKDDVEVFEDAMSQKISFFAHSVDVPLTFSGWSSTSAEARINSPSSMSVTFKSS